MHGPNLIISTIFGVFSSVASALSLSIDFYSLIAVGPFARTALFASIPYASSLESLHTVLRIARTKALCFTECFYSCKISKEDAQTLVLRALPTQELVDRILPTNCVLSAPAIWTVLKLYIDNYHPQLVDIPSNGSYNFKDYEALLFRCLENPSLIGSHYVFNLLDEHFGPDSWMITIARRNFKDYKKLLELNNGYALLVGLTLALEGYYYQGHSSPWVFLNVLFPKRYPKEYELVIDVGCITDTWLQAYNTILESLKTWFADSPLYLSLWHSKLVLLFAKHFQHLFSRYTFNGISNHNIQAYYRVLGDFGKTCQNEYLVRPLYVPIFETAAIILSYRPSTKPGNETSALMPILFRGDHFLGAFKERRAIWKDVLFRQKDDIKWPLVFEVDKAVVRFIATQLYQPKKIKFPLGTKLTYPVRVGKRSLCYTTEELLYQTSRVVFKAWETFNHEATLEDFYSKFYAFSRKLQLANLWQIQANYLYFGHSMLPIHNNEKLHALVLEQVWAWFRDSKRLSLMLRYLPLDVIPQFKAEYLDVADRSFIQTRVSCMGMGRLTILLATLIFVLYLIIK